MQYFNGIAPLPLLRYGRSFKIGLFSLLFLCGTVEPATASAEPASVASAALKAAAKGSDVQRFYPRSSSNL